MKYALWIIQGLLAALFIFSGVMKLVMPIEAMTKEMAMPGFLLRFVGVCEILGGLGLVLPSWLGIRPGLTSLAAIGLLIIMLGCHCYHSSRPAPSAGGYSIAGGLALGVRRLRAAAAAPDAILDG